MMELGEPSIENMMQPSKIFVGGLSWETDEISLKSYFGKYGTVIDSVIMRDRNSGHPRGFGFVTFEDDFAADRVAREKHELDGRLVEAKKAVPRAECTPSTRAVTSSRGSRKIFVGGLPASCDDESLKTHFMSYGEVLEAQVMYDHNTGNSRGFAFVTYSDDSSIDRVMEVEHFVMGKLVEVKHAEPKHLLDAKKTRDPAQTTATATTNPMSRAQSNAFMSSSPLSVGTGLTNSSYGYSPVSFAKQLENYQTSGGSQAKNYASFFNTHPTAPMVDSDEVSPAGDAALSGESSVSDFLSLLSSSIPKSNPVSGFGYGLPSFSAPDSGNPTFFMSSVSNTSDADLLPRPFSSYPEAMSRDRPSSNPDADVFDLFDGNRQKGGWQHFSSASTKQDQVSSGAGPASSSSIPSAPIHASKRWGTFDTYQGLYQTQQTTPFYNGISEWSKPENEIWGGGRYPKQRDAFDDNGIVYPQSRNTNNSGNEHSLQEE
uniref:RRM domain-containing protein n=1 Tax=Timspurckia oligopyrenoides TaxID=708627 RepID=A0A7S0ZCZ9_9RHOD|mmetsp:Transcript_13035/g.23436  ORF Transcript_13035/g.23436 Transcript_13035/m.23436 type:complete len:487 (+) Transcript_13035:220-1680(+)